MSGDSLFGGGTDLSQVVSTASLDLINAFLTDTVGGSAITGSIGDSTVVIGSGSDGEMQGALLPAGTETAGNINDGVLSLDIVIPAGMGFVFEGKDNATPETVGTFLSSIIDAYLPPPEPGAPPADPAVTAMRDSLNNAVNDLVSSLQSLGVTNIVVRMFNPVSGNTPSASSVELAANEFMLDATSSGGNELFMVNLNGLNQDQTLVLSGVENVMLVGEGSVRIAGTAGAMVTSDIASQTIIGGGGNDTLIGGGGNDTLTGGAGDDVFGFVRLGHFTIEDFSAGDSFGFNVPWMHSLSDLVPLLTRVTETPESLTLDFGADFSLTLVGVSASELTADMFKFSF